jgi:hypothetical protein
MIGYWPFTIPYSWSWWEVAITCTIETRVAKVCCNRKTPFWIRPAFLKLFGRTGLLQFTDALRFVRDEILHFRTQAVLYRFQNVYYSSPHKVRSAHRNLCLRRHLQMSLLWINASNPKLFKDDVKTFKILCEISGLRRSVNETFALQVCYAAKIGS